MKKKKKKKKKRNEFLVLMFGWLAGSNVSPFDVSSSQKNASPKNNSMCGFDVRLALVGYQVLWLEMMPRGMLIAIRADGVLGFMST